MKRQGLQISINDLDNLMNELIDERSTWKDGVGVIDDDKKWLVSIINKTPECSDTWELEGGLS
jgi:hypothetical protein